MPDKQTIEGNRLIAEFMGAKIGKGGTKKYPVYTGFKIATHKTGWTASIRDARFHSSWDWQIPVWSKVLTMLRPIVMKHDELKHPDIERFFEIKRNYFNAIEQNNPEKGQKLLVEIIEWYNSLKPQHHE